MGCEFTVRRKIARGCEKITVRRKNSECDVIHSAAPKKIHSATYNSQFPLGELRGLRPDLHAVQWQTGVVADEDKEGRSHVASRLAANRQH
jgi:hypothetical protein